YEGDRPAKNRFSTQSHLAQALALQQLIYDAHLSDFDPIRHISMSPFDVLVKPGSENNYELFFRRDGYAGYRDRFPLAESEAGAF
ncbi:MAG: hypothetical protein AAF492_02005, partial [Verrucomicrobiota bacterium]